MTGQAIPSPLWTDPSTVAQSDRMGTTEGVKHATQGQETRSARVVATHSVLQKIGSKHGISPQEVEWAVRGSMWVTIHPRYPDRILVESDRLLVVLARKQDDIHQLVTAFRK